MFEWRRLADLLFVGFVNLFRESIPFWLYLLVQESLFPLFALVYSCLYFLTCWFPASFHF